MFRGHPNDGKMGVKSFEKMSYITQGGDSWEKSRGGNTIKGDTIKSKMVSGRGSC